jgi:hypothetical protein
MQNEKRRKTNKQKKEHKHVADGADFNNKITRRLANLLLLIPTDTILTRRA